MTKIVIELPEDATLGDITAARGAIVEASTGYVDWAELYGREHPRLSAIGAPGRILLAVVHQLDNELRAETTDAIPDGTVDKMLAELERTGLCTSMRVIRGLNPDVRGKYERALKDLVREVLAAVPR